MPKCGPGFGTIFRKRCDLVRAVAFHNDV